MFLIWCSCLIQLEENGFAKARKEILYTQLYASKQFHIVLTLIRLLLILNMYFITCIFRSKFFSQYTQDVHKINRKCYTTLCTSVNFLRSVSVSSLAVSAASRRVLLLCMRERHESEGTSGINPGVTSGAELWFDMSSGGKLSWNFRTSRCCSPHTLEILNSMRSKRLWKNIINKTNVNSTYLYIRCLCYKINTPYRKVRPDIKKELYIKSIKEWRSYAFPHWQWWCFWLRCLYQCFIVASALFIKES